MMAAETMMEPAAGEAGAPLLSARHLEMAFGGIIAVRDLSFDVFAGEIVGLIGPNGAGKTTSFNMVTGFYRPTRGEVRFLGETVTGRRPYALARMGLVRSFQKTNVMKALTVFENVLTGHFLAVRQTLLDTFLPGAKVRRAEREARDSAAAIVDMIGLSARMDTPAHRLSCGELRLLEVAVALAAKPKLLMLDEPAAGLNSHEAAEFGAILKSLVGTHASSHGDTHVGALLLVEHNMGLVSAVSDRIIVMNFGQKLAEGTPDAVLADGAVIEAYLGKAVE